MDAADLATAQQERLLERHLRARPHQAARVEPGLHCLGCGEEIPDARRRALPGCCLCIDCQEEAERAMGR